MKKIDKIAMGNRIRACREGADLTQERLAEMAELSAGQISNIERGSNVPKLANAIKLADALNISIEYMVRGEDMHKEKEYIFIKFERREWERIKAFMVKLLNKDIKYFNC